MGKKNSKVQQEIVPPLAQYLAQRAQQVRDSAALELQQQEAPDIPVLPRTSDNIIAYWDAKLETPDSTLIERYGVEPNPETCIYTVTTKYGDKDATFTGNKTFKDEYNKRGYVKIHNDSSSTGDLVQLNQLFGLPLVGRPYHTIMQTSTSEEGIPLFSYSRGDTTPYVVEDGRKIATMQKDRPLKNIKGRADSYTTYRYVGSPSKREEWTNEYNNKYGTQRSNGRLGVTTRWSEGGSLKEKSAWDTLSLKEKAAMIKVAVNNGIYDLQTIRNKYNEFAEGGEVEGEKLPPIVPFKQRTEVIITPDSKYNQYLNTLPDNQRFTPNDTYDSYFYWKLNGKPKDFKDAYSKGMFHYDHSDNSYHANSIAYDGGGTGYFRKPKTHDTVGYETDWFIKGLVTEEGGHQRPMTPKEKVEWLDFRRKYMLTSDPNRPNYYMYKPKNKHSIGGPLVDTMLNEYAEGGGIHIKPSHRGRLTELKKRTGKTEAELYRTGSAATRKMITFARNARKWKHGEGGSLFDDGGDMGVTFGHPYYSYDENGKLILDENGQPILNFNASPFDEVVIIPDSKKISAQRNADERARQRNLRDYDENRSKEYTTKQIIQAQRDWENSIEKKALDYAQAATTGIGIGADIVSGLPIYSSLKGANILSRAETPLDYVEGGMWLAPLLGETYKTAKPVVSSAISNITNQSSSIGKELGNPFSFLGNMYNFARRKPISFAEKQAAAQRMEGLIHSPEYIQRQKNAGLSNSEIIDFQNMVSRRLNNGNFPAYTMKRKSNGLSLVLPKPFGGIYMREGMPSEDFLNAFDHEVAHYSTVNFNKADNQLLQFLNRENPSVMEKVMMHNESVVPKRPESDVVNVRSARGLDAEPDWLSNPDNQRKLAYYRDDQELRSNAYAMLQEAKRRGISVDELVDQYTMQSTGEIFGFAPKPLKFLNYAYNPEDMKKFIKGFLSVSAPFTLVTKLLKDDTE